jgi:O-antigen/teichoic acid export membrane protein
MNTVQRIAKNTAALFAAQIVVAILGLVLSICIARMLGDVIFGKYSFALAFTAIFAIFLSLGFPTLIVRDVARDKSLASKYLGNIAVIKVILSVIIFGLVALTINLMHYPHDTTIAVLIFGIYIVLLSFADIFRITFRAFERMEYEACVVTIRQILTVSLGLAAIFLGYGLIAIACVFLIGGIFDFLLSFLICSKKFAKPKIEIDINFWKNATKSALPLAFLGAAVIIYIRIDTVMLSAMKGDAVVGWYNAAYSLVLALKAIPHLFINALFPVMAGFFISSRSSLKVAYEKSLQYLLILGLPLAAGTALLADQIIPLFYGEQFSNSIIILQILAWDILLFFLHESIGTVLIAMNKQNQMATIAGGCAVINIILNLILIPIIFLSCFQIFI